MKSLYILIIIGLAPIQLQIYSQIPDQTFSKQQKRIALVIGNGNYLIGSLANPENDARAMKIALQNVGFIVIEYENLNQGQMKRAIDEFGENLKNNDVGLFYYAGHGIQSNGINFLIPVDAQLNFEKQVEYDCVQADRVLAIMQESGAKVNIMILDACRNNPFERSWSRSVTGRGLAFMNAPSGTLIAYATSPGSTASDGSGKNGLYTSAILESIQISDITILQMFQNVRNTVVQKSNNQQTPWESTSLTGDFYFNQPEIFTEIEPFVGNIKEPITFSSIELTTDISGELYMDGKKIANVTSNTTIPIHRVITGGHRLEILGNENWTENISVNNDQPLRVYAKRSVVDDIYKLANSGEFVDDRDGKKYKWVKIGNQVWMAENLAYLPKVSPPKIESTTIPYYYVYDFKGNKISDAKNTYNYNTYGVLYNWPAAMNADGSSTSNHSGVQGVCPSGWHLPGNEEWIELTDYVGGISVAGSKLKESGKDHWKKSSKRDLNKAGFTALPGGFRRHDGKFNRIRIYGCYWSATEYNALSALRRYFYFDDDDVDIYHNLKELGFSVRCVKD